MKAKPSPKASRTAWSRLRQMPDRAIKLDDPPELGPEFFRQAQLRLPQAKQAVSLRLDPEVLAWFRQQGPGYQTRMNAVLRAYMEAQSR